jgi:hypothetical protein
MEARIAKLENLLLQQQSLFPATGNSNNGQILPNVQELKADAAAETYLAGVQTPLAPRKIEVPQVEDGEISQIERNIKQSRVCAIRFRDAVGRLYTFPFDNVDTWAGLSNLLTAIFAPISTVGPHVAAGHYDIFNSANEIILPGFWSQKIEPGAYYSMYMWPMPGQVPPPEWACVHFVRDRCAQPFRPGPPVGHPPPPPPWMAGRPRRRAPSSVSSSASSGTAVDLHENCGIRGVWNRFKGIFKRKKNEGKDSDTRSISSGSSRSLVDD